MTRIARKPGPPPERLVFFTIVANNYMAYARTLMASLAEHHPGAERYVVLCDEPTHAVDYGTNANILPVSELGLTDFDAMAFYYDVMEFSTAVKPTSFLHLAELHPGHQVIYLDPDILVAAPLVHIVQALNDGASLVLTPHITAPLQDGLNPDDLTIMKSGIYNLGFAGFRMTEESIAFIHWWRDRCQRDAIVDIADNKFTDQRWMDMAPAMVRHTHILHHHSYNLAYWNLLHRKVTQDNQMTLVDGDPLRFVHFSGVSAKDRGQFSKHQDRFTTATIGDLRPLFERYVDLLLENDWASSSTVPYAYNFFTSGRKIHPMMRGCYRLTPEGLPAAPAEGNGAAFDGREPSLAALGPPPITRVMHELIRRRTDLQRNFDIETADGRRAYLQWFVDGGSVQAGFDNASLLAAKEMLDRSSRPGPLMKPWPPQVEHAAMVTGAERQAWLCKPVPLNIITGEAGVPMPRCAALLWEQRADLAAHFRCQTEAELTDYLLWCMTSGVLEKSVDIALLAPATAAFLNAVEEPAAGPSPPVTRLMRLMAARYDGQFPDDVKEFPATLRSRLALVLWLIGEAATRYGWPDSFLAAPLEWAKQRAVIGHAGGPLLTWLLYGLWYLRTDVRETMDIAATPGQIALLAWAVGYGLQETKLPPRLLSEEVLSFLGRNFGAHPDFLRYHQMSWLSRPPLKAQFSISTPEGQAELVAFMAADADARDGAAWLSLLRPSPAPAPARDRHARVLLTGEVSAFSGRGEDVRMTAAALKANKVRFALLDRSTEVWSEPDIDPGDIDINIMHHNADTAFPDHLFLRREKLDHAYQVGYWAWELSRLPPLLVHACSFYDEIWASTQFAYDAFRGASERPVFLMPMPVEMPELDATLTRADFDLPADHRLFYFGFDFGSYASRKNPEAAIWAFRLAFPTGDEKTTLLIKTMNAARHPAEFRQLQAIIGDDKRIILRDHKYSARELATLISLCDGYLSLHRSEGFGRGPAEAMLLGKPVIATGYSGNCDFMTQENAFLVRHKLVPLTEGQYLGWQGQEWADADATHAATLLRQIVKDPALARRVAEAGRKTIAENYNAVVIGKRYRTRIVQIRKLRAARTAEEA